MIKSLPLTLSRTKLRVGPMVPPLDVQILTIAQSTLRGLEPKTSDMAYIPISSHTSMPTAFAASFKRLKTTFPPSGAGQQPHNEQSLRAKHNVVRCNNHQTLNTIAALFQATFNAKQPYITCKLQSHLSLFPKNLQKDAVCHCSPLYSLVIRHCISCSMTGLVGHSRGICMDQSDGEKSSGSGSALAKIRDKNMESDD